MKGAQKDVDLTNSYDFAKVAIRQFFEGKTYISNNPSVVINKLEAELAEMTKDLLME